MAGKEYSVVLALKASDQASGPIQSLGNKLKMLRGQMSAAGREAGFKGIGQEITGLKGAFGSLAGVGGMLGGAFAPLAGLGAVMGLNALVQGAADAADALGDMSQRIFGSFEDQEKKGIRGVEVLQQWQFAAKLSGSTAEEMAVGMEKLNVTIGDAVNGTGKGKDVFAALGIKLKDTSGRVKNADSVLKELSDKMVKIKDPAERAAVAAALLGKQAGPQLAPMLAQGSEALEELFQKSKKHGQITQEQAKAAGEFNDAMDEMGSSVSGFARAIGLSLLPLFMPLTLGMTDWLDVNREMMASGVGEFGEFLGAVFSALGDAASWAWGVLNEWPSLMAVLVGVFGFLALSMFPVIGTIGLVVAAGFALWKYWEPIKEFFLGLWDDVKPVWEGFFNAVVDWITMITTPLRAAFELMTALGNVVTGKGWNTDGIKNAVKEGGAAGGRMLGRVGVAGKAVYDALPKTLERPDFGILKDGGNAPVLGVPAARPQDVVGLPRRGVGSRPGDMLGGASQAGLTPAGLMMAPVNENKAEVTVRLLADGTLKVENVKQQGAGLRVRTDVPTGKSRVGTG